MHLSTCHMRTNFNLSVPVCRLKYHQMQDRGCSPMEGSGLDTDAQEDLLASGALAVAAIIHFHAGAVTHKHVPALPLYSTCMAVTCLRSPNKAPQGLSIGHNSPQHQASAHCTSQCCYLKACSCLVTPCACCMCAEALPTPNPTPSLPCPA